MSDQPITSIMIIASTARMKYAGSDMYAEIMIPGVAATEAALPGNKGETRVFTIGASGTKKASEISPADISISTEPPNEGNAWLPSALYILGKGDSSDYQVICAIPEWPEQVWLSQDPNDHYLPDAVPAISLDLVLKALNPA